jgi:membrane fusion protein (multidrug efflux system)
MTNIKKLHVLLSLLTVASCNSPEEVTKKLDTHEVASPIVKDISENSEYVAQIQSVKYVEVRSKVKGYIEKIYIDEGQFVKEGQLLFTLNSLEFEKGVQKADAAYKSAIADYRAAEVELANVQKLVEKDIVSKAELDVINAKSDALKADMDEALVNKEQAVLQLSFSHIRAPYNGILNRIPNKSGSLIAEGDVLTSISDSHEVFAYFNLSEIDYLNYILSAEEQTKIVRLRLANQALYNHLGKIEMIESEIDHGTGNIAFRARFPNPDATLKHGSHGKVMVNKAIKNALLVPQKSTFEIQDKLYVFVVNNSGILAQRNIISKMRIPDFYVVESGLTKEEKILFEGVANVKDGYKIEPIEIDLKKAMSLESE